MNKRITSLLLCFVMLFATLATAVPVFAEGTSTATFTVEADKSKANPGDTITYTISIQQSSGTLTCLEATIIIPSGLTYVANSAKVTEGVSQHLGWIDSLEGVAWTEEAMMVNGFGTNEFTGTEKIELLKLQCKVNDDAAAGDYTVDLKHEEQPDLVADEGPSADFASKNPVAIPATVTVTIPHKHVYNQENTDENHLKTPATCTSAAVYYKSCTCGENGTETFTSGSALGHDYTLKLENDTYLKTAATNCTEHNVYWYACSRCKANAKNDTSATDKYYTGTIAGKHSFTEKIEDDAHYVAGTGEDCMSVRKYYYDCAYCDLIGTETWNSETKGPHTYAEEFSSDKDHHWHECVKCHDKKDVSAHNPGAEATETTPQICTDCGYVITPALGHTHNMTPVAAKPATCTENGNKAYYICSGCGKWYEDATGNVEITDHDDVVIASLGHDWADATCTDPKTCKREGCGATEGFALGHNYATEWSSNAEGHWHACTRCGDKTDESAHTPDRDAATETDPIKCEICDFIITPALGHTHNMTKVDANPATCTEDGNIEYYKCEGCGKLFADATGNVELTADKIVDKAAGHDYEWKIDKEATATEKGSKHEECKVCGDKKAAVEIPATGTSAKPEKTTEPTKSTEQTKSNNDQKSPQTGDSSNMILWFALLFVCGGAVAGTTIYSRKRKA